MLTDVVCKNAKTKDKPYKIYDEKGMFLLINPGGQKYFRFKYRYLNKEKVLALGVYPETSLKEARDKRDQARKQLADGIDPTENKKAAKLVKEINEQNSFELIGREWYLRNLADKSDSHRARTMRNLEHGVFPYIGKKVISEVKPPELLAVLRKVEERGAIETTRRILQVCGQIFRYAIATGRCESDISQHLKGSLKPVTHSHYGAITDPLQLGGLLRAIDDYTGSKITKAALQIAPFVFVRPGELRSMEWEHLDIAAKEWRYFVNKTKVQHIVPLANQVISILKEIEPFTQGGRFVFPSERTPNGSRCLSDMALLAGLRRMGFSKEEATVHGFRATARTILDEVLGFRPDFIEHQLAHAVKDPNGRAYNRTSHLKERHNMMQVWADYLDKLKAGAEIIPFDKNSIAQLNC